MDLSNQQYLFVETQPNHCDRGCPGLDSSITVSNTLRSSSHVPQSDSAHLHPINTEYDEEEMGYSDDGCDSDSTLDLDEATLSPLLRNTPPLQRMSRDHERIILRSLSQGSVITYSCVCNRAMQSCAFNNERKEEESTGSSEGERSDDEWTDEELKSSFRPRVKYTFPGFLGNPMKKVQDSTKMDGKVDTYSTQLSVESDTDIGVAAK